MNGDGLPDIVGIYDTCVYVSLNTGSSFQPAACWLSGGAFAPATGWTDMDTYPRFLADVNGDGLPDIVGIYNTCIYVSVNTGTSFPPPSCWLGGGAFSPATGWINVSGDTSNAHPRFLADINGDGMADIVGIYENQVFVALSNGASFPGIQSWLTGGPLLTGSWPDTTPRMLVDSLGTGRAGILGIGNQGLFVAPSGGNSVAPDLLASITNGLGAATSITYASAVNSSVVTKGIGTKFPTMDMVAPLYVVSRVTTSNGLGGTYSSAYTYAGGRIDMQGRGFLGFAQTSVKDLQTGIADTTTYRQDFPYLGMVASTVRSYGALTLGQSVNTYQFVGLGGATTIGPASAPYQVSLSQNVSSGTDLDGSALPTVTTSNQYDAFGNATQVVVSTPDGFSKTTTSTFTNDTTNWYLGRLVGASVTSIAP